VFLEAALPSDARSAYIIHATNKFCVLANVMFLYCRAAWQYAFDPDATLDQDFTTYINGTPKVRHAPHRVDISRVDSWLVSSVAGLSRQPVKL
jgi:hypothetical protein